ncbi:MAG: NAD(P)-dependent oxidoreductase [Gammaproteobacteria bacterium]
MIVVIGAFGFIGTYLVDELLMEKNEVIATGRNEVSMGYLLKKGASFVKLDITKADDFYSLPTQGVKAVVLLAATLPANVRNYNPFDYVNTNVNGTLNVLEYCRINKIPKIIFTSSYADVRNLWAKDKPITEKMPRDFLFTGDHALYVITKNMACDLIEHYSQEYGIQGIVFRLPPVYGYGPHLEIYENGKYYKSGFQVFVEKAIRGEQIEIWGDSKISRDIVYIKDVISAFISALKSTRAAGLYNITSGVPLSLDEQVRTTIKVFSLKDKISGIVYRPDKKSTGFSYVFDITKAKQDFGYAPKFISFERMLLDYKEEIKKGRCDFLVASRKKSRDT